jgi:hypothetical protein
MVFDAAAEIAGVRETGPIRDRGRALLSRRAGRSVDRGLKSLVRQRGRYPLLEGDL